MGRSRVAVGLAAALVFVSGCGGENSNSQEEVTSAPSASASATSAPPVSSGQPRCLTKPIEGNYVTFPDELTDYEPVVAVNATTVGALYSDAEGQTKMLVLQPNDDWKAADTPDDLELFGGNLAGTRDGFLVDYSTAKGDGLTDEDKTMTAYIGNDGSVRWTAEGSYDDSNVTDDLVRVGDDWLDVTTGKAARDPEAVPDEDDRLDVWLTNASDGRAVIARSFREKKTKRELRDPDNVGLYNELKTFTDLGSEQVLLRQEHAGGEVLSSGRTSPSDWLKLADGSGEGEDPVAAINSKSGRTFRVEVDDLIDWTICGDFAYIAKGDQGGLFVIDMTTGKQLRKDFAQVPEGSSLVLASEQGLVSLNPRGAGFSIVR